MITRLKTTNLGPSETMDLEFAPRVNLITGDNGLGKSFVLDLVWFVLTRQWPQEVNPTLLSGDRARPTDRSREARIEAEFDADGEKAASGIVFDRAADTWTFPAGKSDSYGLVFYAMADGSFALWDPLRNRSEDAFQAVAPAYVFNSRQAFDGLPGVNGKWLCEGLIKDWVLWQDSLRYEKEFALFKEVLNTLSADGCRLLPGEPRKVSPDDSRLIPTLQMAYGQPVPITNASSGVKRIATLAYLLMWAWFEHVGKAEMLGVRPEERITFLFDEVESHLHPRWQRAVIPALLRTARYFAKDVGTRPNVQLIVSTHSPLVMSSLEGEFDSKSDRWFDLDFREGEVSIADRKYLAMGSADNWLTSEAFDLNTTYSLRAEEVLNEAKRLLRSKSLTKEEWDRMTEKLSGVLSETDPYWINWSALAHRKGFE